MMHRVPAGPAHADTRHDRLVVRRRDGECRAVGESADRCRDARVAGIADQACTDERFVPLRERDNRQPRRHCVRRHLAVHGPYGRADSHQRRDKQQQPREMECADHLGEAEVRERGSDQDGARNAPQEYERLAVEKRER